MNNRMLSIRLYSVRREIVGLYTSLVRIRNRRAGVLKRQSGVKKSTLEKNAGIVKKLDVDLEDLNGLILLFKEAEDLVNTEICKKDDESHYMRKLSLSSNPLLSKGYDGELKETLGDILESLVTFLLDTKKAIG